MTLDPEVFVRLRGKIPSTPLWYEFKKGQRPSPSSAATDSSLPWRLSEKYVADQCC